MIKNRTFLFGNFEEQRLRTDGVITVKAADAEQINAHLQAVGYRAPLLPVVSTPTTEYQNTLHTDTVFLRADHRVSERDQLTARYSFYHLSSLNARGVGALNEVSNGTSVFDANHTFAASNVLTISPRTFNESRVQFI
ncbi:MAG: hypothetical protein PW735_00275, partial [Acidobacteriaceae bacterium]|nr:hypothetical protein [Acidobacteriaceae bacterium]